MGDGGAGDVHHHHADGVRLLEGGGAGELPGVLRLCPHDTQSVLQGGVSHRTLGPTLSNIGVGEMISKSETDHGILVPGRPACRPLRSPRPLEEETLHVERGPGVHDQLSSVALGDGAVLVPEQHGGRLVDLVVVHLVESDTPGLPAVKVAPDTPPPLRALHPKIVLSL